MISSITLFTIRTLTSLRTACEWSCNAATAGRSCSLLNSCAPSDFSVTVLNSTMALKHANSLLSGRILANSSKAFSNSSTSFKLVLEFSKTFRSKGYKNCADPITKRSRHDSSKRSSRSDSDKVVKAGTFLAHLTFMKRSLAAASHIASGLEGDSNVAVIGGGEGTFGGQ